MSRETPKTTPALVTVPVGTRVTDEAGQAGTITLVRRRKWARRYRVQFDNGNAVLVRRSEFKTA